ncbi:unnamed protein product [Pedinophyceae sp. YPF-701]|nr:unnamed protein product [Pedinophyceae sp. YPF-701]
MNVALSARPSAVPAARGRGRCTRAQAARGPGNVNAATLSASEQKQRIIADENKYILQTYGRPTDIVVSHGKGCTLWDVDGKEYLDFYSGIAVNALGHSHPRWVKAVKEQADLCCHVSNLFHTEPQTVLAKAMVEKSFADRVFFCNSGTEANEAAIKFARKYARVTRGIDAYDAEASRNGPSHMVAFTNSFHGRTLGALSLTSKVQYRTPFEPVVGPVSFAKYLDLESARQAVRPGETCAIFVEPVQGEGGVHPATAEFLQGLRDLADEIGACLVFDEVQCGVGRTGKLWGHENFGVTPHIMSVAKPLAGGLPVGAVLMTQAVADCMSPGDHGTTFAGSPFVSHVAAEVFDEVSQPAFLATVGERGQQLMGELRNLTAGNAHVKEVRGSGLLIGVQLDQAAGPVVLRAREKGLLAITAGAGDVVRLVPPLILSEAEASRGAAILAEAIEEVCK